jgi:hypothetical protein
MAGLLDCAACHAMLGVKDGRGTRPPPAAVKRSLTPARAVISGTGAIPPENSENIHEHFHNDRREG